MSDFDDVRRAHNLLDNISSGYQPSDDDLNHLRSFLPEQPIQKGLEEIAWDIDFAWAETSGNDWKEEMFGDLETWLSEQHAQLRAHLEGVKSEAHPALPAGMRIAEHENFGRVVVSPGVGIDRCHEIFYLDPGMSSGTDISEVEPDSLTFLDSEPAKPTHPEFLETESDYVNTPVGTVVVYEDGYPWTRIFGSWAAYSCGQSTPYEMAALRGKARVLRWGGGVNE